MHSVLRANGRFVPASVRIEIDFDELDLRCLCADAADGGAHRLALGYTPHGRPHAPTVVQELSDAVTGDVARSSGHQDEAAPARGFGHRGSRPLGAFARRSPRHTILPIAVDAESWTGGP